MFNAIGRKITGNPCIGCPVRDTAYYPERVYGEGYMEGFEFNPVRFNATQVHRTCEEALGGLSLSASERFEACSERMGAPNPAADAMAIRLKRIFAKNNWPPDALG